MGKINYESSGKEVRVIDFVSDQQWAVVKGVLSKAGVRLGAYCDPSQSNFRVVREFARRGLPVANLAWRNGVQALCAQVAEDREILQTKTPYGHYNFGIAIPNLLHSLYVPPVQHGPGEGPQFNPQPEFSFLTKEHLLTRQGLPTFQSLPQMAVTIQYRDAS